MDEALREVLRADPRVAFALVFGSVARGEATPHSDLDVAIGLTRTANFDANDVGALVAALERAAQCDVDLVIVNEAPSPITYRIFRDGRLIFEADRKTRVELQTLAILEYLDFKWVEDMCTRGVIEAAARG